MMGYARLGQLDDVDKAIELFELNVENFPESSSAYDSLGEAYRVKGDKAQAIEHYQKSLELDPSNQNAREKLEELQGSRGSP